MLPGWVQTVAVLLLFIWLVTALTRPPGLAAQAASVTGFAVRSTADDVLYSVDLTTGAATPIGPVGFAAVNSLTFACDGTLFGIDDVSNRLVRINTQTGVGTAIGPLGVDVENTGLTFDGTGTLYLSTDTQPSLFRVDRQTGLATRVGTLGQAVTGLAATTTTIFGLGGDNNNNLVTVNPATGATTSVGPLRTVQLTTGGLDFDANGTLWGIADTAAGGASRIFTINTVTGAATLGASTQLASGVPLNGFQGLAVAGGTPCQIATPTPTPSSAPPSTPTATPSPASGAAVDPNDDDEPRRLTKEQRQQRQRTNRLGLDDVATEGNVTSLGCDEEQPEVQIANRDGLVRILLLKDAASVCSAIRLGDYLEVEGVKQNEQLYEAENVTIWRPRR